MSCSVSCPVLLLHVLCCALVLCCAGPSVPSVPCHNTPCCSVPSVPHQTCQCHVQLCSTALLHHTPCCPVPHTPHMLCQSVPFCPTPCCAAAPRTCCAVLCHTTLCCAAALWSVLPHPAPSHAVLGGTILPGVCTGVTSAPVSLLHRTGTGTGVTGRGMGGPVVRWG